MFQLKGKNILVTGGSRGIGAGIVEHLASLGARVAFTYSKNETSAKNVLNKLAGEGHFFVQMEIQNPSSVEGAFRMVLEKLGKLDGLVNNAGIAKDQLLLRMNLEDFQSVLETNLTGTFLCTKAAIKPMLRARSGSIVNITSIIGQTGNPGQSNYAASKAGIEGFSKSIAKEMGRKGLRVNCIAPGFIQTDMTEEMQSSQQEALLKSTALGRLGTVQDIACATAFLLSEESSFITGHTLNVNGGLYI